MGSRGRDEKGGRGGKLEDMMREVIFAKWKQTVGDENEDEVDTEYVQVKTPKIAIGVKCAGVGEPAPTATPDLKPLQSGFVSCQRPDGAINQAPVSCHLSRVLGNKTQFELVFH